MKRLLLLVALAGCGSAPAGLEGTFWVTPGLATQNVAFDADGRYTLRTFHPNPALEMGTWTADATAVDLTPDGAATKRIRYTRSHDAKWLWLWWWTNGSTAYMRTQPPAP